LSVSFEGAIRGTETGGSAATFCGTSAGFAGSAWAFAAAPFKNTSSTIWSK
jgi:hypothetical protein